MKLKPFASITGTLSGGLMLALLAGCDSGKTTSAPAVTPAQPASSTPAASSALASIEVANPSDFERQQEPLYFSFYDLGIDGGKVDTAALVARSAQQPLPSQLIDQDADGTADGILIAANLAPGETINITLEVDASPRTTTGSKHTQAEISHKIGGEWDGKKYIGGTFQNVQKLTTPPQYTDHSEYIRYEGPGIESDKVAYRFYLDWRNGFDIFGKKTPAMVLQDVGQDGYKSYHDDAEWGLDILKAAKSLGVGSFGFWNGKNTELVSDVAERTATIVENGDLYSALTIDYNDWKVNDQTLDLRAHMAMHAGSRLVHTRITLSEDLPNLAIGFVKQPDTKIFHGPEEISGYAWTYVASWGKQSLSGPDSNLGLAVIFRKQHRRQQTEDEFSHVSVMSTAGKELEYYFLAAWDGEHDGKGITTEEEFVAYLDQEIKRLTYTPRVRLDTALDQAKKQFPITAEAALAWSKRLADSELERKALDYHADGWDVNRRRVPNFEYDIIGLQPMAFDELAKVTGEEKYQQVIHKVTGSFIKDDGDIRGYKIENYNIDAIKPGRVVLRLFQQTGEEKYRKAAELLNKQLQQHPRTSEGAFWHKQAYPHQVWLDGVYMGMPFLAEYTSMFEEGKHLDEAVKEFLIVHEKLRDSKTGLYYHAWDESRQMNWADKETGLSSFFWGRGLGWLAMALVDVLDYIPEGNTELRQPLLDMITELGRDLVPFQDESGTWYQIMDQPDRLGNYRESSGSAMFAYFYAKAVNKGYLPESYKETAIKAYEGLIREFVTVHQDGLISMTHQCLVAGLGFGRDGSYDYYMSERIFSNDPKGNGPFILAGIEVYKLLNDQD